jgi:hypothetical protein
MPAEHLGSVARSSKITYEKEANKGGSKIDNSGYSYVLYAARPRHPMVIHSARLIVNYLVGSSLFVVHLFPNESFLRS